MINTGKYIKQQPDRVVQRMISIFGKKKCACGCDGTHGNSGGTVAPMAHNLITGSGFPSEETVGNLGDYYRDELNNRTFECVDITEKNEGINGQPAAQASDGEDISYINIDSLDEGEYAVLITSDNQVRNLYQKQNGEPVELPFEQFSTENDIYFNSDVKHAVVINGGNNLFYIYTPAETYKEYHWAATEHRTIDLILPDEIIKGLQNVGMDLIFLLYEAAANFRENLKELYTGDNISFYDENENYIGTIEATKSIESWFDATGEFLFNKQELYESFIMHPAPCTDGGSGMSGLRQNSTVIEMEKTDNRTSLSFNEYRAPTNIVIRLKTGGEFLVYADTMLENIWHKISLQNYTSEEITIDSFYIYGASSSSPITIPAGESFSLILVRIGDILLIFGKGFLHYGFVNNPT